MAKKNFTEKKIKEIKATDVRQTYRDAKQPGLGLRIEPAGIGGRKSWFYNAKVGGRVLHKSIGSFETVSVKVARSKAKKLAADADKWQEAGFPPVLAGNAFGKEPKPEATNLAPTFSVLVESYIKNHLHNADAEINHPEQAEKALRYTIGRYFGSWMPRPVDSFTIGDVIALRDSAKPLSHMPNRLVQTARTLFNWCANEDGKVNVWPLTTNPAAKLKLAPEDPRERWLSPSELVILEYALDDKETPQDLADFVRLALDTLARKENILAMKFSEYDADMRQWRIPMSKSGEYYVVDLLPRAVQIIERRRGERKSTSEYVFAAPGGKRGYLRLDKSFKALLQRAESLRRQRGIDGTFLDVRIHDLRRSAATYQASAGVPLQKIAGNLGHSDRNIESVLIYAKLAQADLPEARQAGADKMAALMDAARKRMKSQETVPTVPVRKSA